MVPTSTRRLGLAASALALAAALLATPSATAATSDGSAAPTGTITGKAVWESDGYPPEGLRVSARPFEGGPDAPETDSVVSGVNGAFTLNVPDGAYLVTVHTSEYRFGRSSPTPFDHFATDSRGRLTDRVENARPVVIEDGAAITDVLLMVWPDMNVEGIVTSPSEPALLKDVEVSMREQDGTLAGRTTVGTGKQEARYSIGNLRTGTYTVGVRKGGIVDEPEAATMTVIVETGNVQLVDIIELQRYTRNTSRPTVSSTSPKIGVPLKASPGEWTRTTGVTWRYQWYMDGIAIDAGKQADYTPSPGTLGKALTVKVTAVRQGDVVDSATSAPTSRTAAGEIKVLTKPSLAAARYPVVGDRISRDLGRWTPSGLSWGYQWLRDGATISGQRSSSYVLQSSDWGKNVSLRVTGSRTGYRSTTSTTDSVLVKRAPSMSNTTTVLGGGKVKLTAKVVVVGTSRPSGSVDVYEDDEKIATIPSLTNGVGSVTVSGRTPGAHRYTLTYSGNSLVVPASRYRDVVVR